MQMIAENFGQDAMYSLNSDKIRKQLGWNPQVKLERNTGNNHLD